MLVDSSGSKKPAESPMATQFFRQCWRLCPVLNRMSRGSIRVFSRQVAHQRCMGFVVADMLAAKNEPIANSFLQRNSPLPTETVCD